MAQTEALLRAQLLPDLADIVLACFRAAVRTPSLIAKAGEYEACMSLDLTIDLNNHDCELKIAGASCLCIPNCNWRIGSLILAGACAGDHFNIVWSVIGMNDDIRTDEDVGLAHACSHGQVDIARMMLMRVSWDRNRCLGFACFGGHRNCMALMIEHGATECDHCNRPAAEHLA